MQRALKLFRWFLLGALIIGVVGTIVYGFGAIIASKTGLRIPDANSGHVFPYEIRSRGGYPYGVVYVSHVFSLTSQVSGFLAATCLGGLAVLGFGLLYGNLLRLLLPATFESANLELARYRKAVGPAKITEEGLRYVAAWRDLGRRRLLPFCTIFGGIGLAWLLPRSPWNLAIIGLSLLILILPMIRRGQFICPRCHERFYGKWRSRYLPAFCTNCGLSEKSPPTTGVSPAFIEWKKTL